MKENLILKKVKEDYTQIASEFDITRAKPWPEFALFSEALKNPPKGKKMKLLDVGCGNGRLYDFLNHEKVSYTGIDNNKALLTIAKKNHPVVRFKLADMQELPFSKESFDTVWCIAALHHLPTKALQKKALKNMQKILKKGGTLMLTVWNLWQPKYQKYIDKKSHNSLIPWGSPPKAFRFYYAFTANEIGSLLKEVGFSKLKKVGTHPNVAYVCTK